MPGGRGWRGTPGRPSAGGRPEGGASAGPGFQDTVKQLLKGGYYEQIPLPRSPSLRPLHPWGAAPGPAVHKTEHQRKSLPPLSKGSGGGQPDGGGKTLSLFRPHLRGPEYRHCQALWPGSGKRHLRQRLRRDSGLRLPGLLRGGNRGGLRRHHLRLL